MIASRGSGPDLELLLVRRASQLAFFGGYWAFPGGALDAADHDGDASDPTGLLRCGLRELFEELGLLPGPLALEHPPAERQSLREALLADAPDATASFRSWLDAAPQALSGLSPVGVLTTPAFTPRRFRTQFLHLEPPADQEPVVDGGELTDCRWARPAALLDEWRSGDCLIVPPVVYLLELFVELGLAGFLSRAPGILAAHEAGRVHPIRSTPGIRLVPLATPTLPPATTTNCYIVGNERLFIIDPATYEEPERARLFAFLDDLVARGHELAGVVATHHHHDHVGSIEATARRYGLPVYAHPRTLERLPSAPAQPLALNEGDELELGSSPDGRPAWRLRTLFTPGHDQGHLCFLDSRYGALIAGDLVSTVSTIVIEPPEGHMATYLASLQRVRELEPGLVYPAHGPAERDGCALLTKYLDHRAKRRRSLERALLESGAGRLEQLVPRVYSDVPERLHALAAQSLLAGLQQLQEEGLASCAGGIWTPTANLSIPLDSGP